MILLDTNVVSELIKRHVHHAVATFISSTSIGDLFLPSIVVAEIRFGMGRLPAGRRRSEIEGDFDTFLRAGFASRILPFDASCAAGYATARLTREQAGRPVQVLDALIGGLALVHGATLATRNIADFDGYGLSLVNPWDAAAPVPPSTAAPPRRRGRLR